MAREDQNYIIDLCDEVLHIKAKREHRFNFLRGDKSRKYPNGMELPVDAYYEQLNLVIEFEESHHSKPVKLFDKPGKLTISGIVRAEQRIKYVELRKTVLPEHGINLIFFSFDEFELKRKRLKRNKEKDLKIITKKLSRFIH